MFDIIIKNYILKLILLRQSPILICVCLVQVYQTAGPQFTCGSFGFFGSHHVKLLSQVHTAQRLHFTNQNVQFDKMAKLVIDLGRGIFLFTYS